jgi:single-stranded DNA-binding protein
MAINKVTLEGNLVSEAEVKIFSGDKAKATIRLAISFYNASTKTQTAPLFVAVTLWNDIAKNFKGKKGDLVSIEGRIVDDSYTKDEVKYSRIGIVANKVEVKAIKKVVSKEEQN